MKMRTNVQGVTLIEVLLVLSIMGMIIYLSTGYLQQRTLATRMDRTSLQMQQILNAGMTYYVANGSWPTSLSCLQGLDISPCDQAYLPSPISSPFGQEYTVVPSTNNPPALLYVYTEIISTGTTGSAVAIASSIAGQLPLAYTTATAPLNLTTPPPNDGTCIAGKDAASSPTSCYVVASINIPGQNLNNATAVNFSGVYHSGSCVPVPTCPVDANGNTMTPQIIVAPVSVTGAISAPTSSSTCNVTDTSGCQVNAYPLSSFTAFATPYAEQPNACSSGTPAPCVSNSGGNPLPEGNYWRVCLSVSTQAGTASPTSTTWGEVVGTVMAVTRCAIQDEPSGSGFDVWSK